MLELLAKPIDQLQREHATLLERAQVIHNLASSGAFNIGEEALVSIENRLQLYKIVMSIALTAETQNEETRH